MRSMFVRVIAKYLKSIFVRRHALLCYILYTLLTFIDLYLLRLIVTYASLYRADWHLAGVDETCTCF